MTAPALPYGPQTAAIRRYLVRLAGLSASDRRAMVAEFSTLSTTRAYDAAETALAHAIERSGREAARDALSGPLLQLVRAPDSANTADDLDALDPVAEPALAALLALLVHDLLEPAQFDVLYAAGAALVPLGDVILPSST